MKDYLEGGAASVVKEQGTRGSEEGAEKFLGGAEQEAGPRRALGEHTFSTTYS